MPCSGCRKRRENITATLKATKRAVLDRLRRAARHRQSQAKEPSHGISQGQDAKAAKSSPHAGP